MNSLEDLENILGIHFVDRRHLTTALTHRSYLNENKEITESNERLEFLGDSVLSLLVSFELFSRFKNYPEGKLTNLRSLLVKTKTLGELATSLHLGEYLFMSRGEEHGGGRENHSLLADTFEAVLGAIYLDQGLPAAKNFLEKTLFPMITQVEGKAELLDYKSSLQEKTQEQVKVSPVYKVLSEVGPDHDKTFTVGVYLSAKLISKGQGKSKQTAEQEAARLALEKRTEIT